MPISALLRTAWVTTSPSFTSSPSRNRTAPRYGPMKVPTELNVWLKVRRKWLYFGSPSAAASGLAATCRMVMPLARMNRPSSTSV